MAERIKSSDGHAEAMTAVIPLYLAAENVDLAAELANTVDDPYTRDRLLTLVAEKCAEMDDDEYALQLADAVEDEGQRSQAFERVGLQKASKGQFEKAGEIAAQMAHPDAVYGGIAVRQAGMGDQAAAAEALELIEYPGAAVAALEEMAAMKINSANELDAEVLLDQAAVRAEEIEHSEEKIRALCSIGDLFIAAKQNVRAVETFEKARAAADALGNVHRDGFLGLASLGFLHAGNVELADRTLDLVSDKTQIATCLLGYAREYWKNDERSEAIEALEEAYAILKSQHERETRSTPEKLKLFASIAAQFAGFEKGERAIEIAQGIEDEQQQMSALSQIAAILTLRKEDEQARHALRAIADDANRVFALIGMSDAKEKNGAREAAIALLDEAALIVETVPQLPARTSAYVEIAKRYTDFGEDDKASQVSQVNLETVVSIRDESAKTAALASMAEFYVSANRELTEKESGTLQTLLHSR